MFIEIHSLHTYGSSVLLNRDQNGIGKRTTFGGTERMRISSQCLKRHWRATEDEFAFHNIENLERSVRSRNIIPELVIKPLRENPQFSQETLDAVENAMNLGVHGSNGATEAHRQSILLGMPEIEHLRAKASEICEQHPADSAAATQAVEQLFNQSRPEGKSLRAMLTSAQAPFGVTAAMHGRMITSDVKANIDSAVNVSHAFTVSAAETTPDFFTAVDDLGGEGDALTSLLATSELNSGIYYGLVVVDLPTLVSNITGERPENWMQADRELAALLVRNIIHIIAKVSPGAKKGSTAPYTYADLMLVEVGTAQPRSMAKAYLNPCESTVESAVDALRNCMQKEDSAYRNSRARAFTCIEETGLPEARQMDIYELAEWTAQRVRDGKTAGAGAGAGA